MSLHGCVVRYWSAAISGKARGPASALVRALLTILSWDYGLVMKLRNLVYDRQFWMFKTVRLPAAVVSVGNIAVGGTGKTPFVALLAARLLARLRERAQALGLARMGLVAVQGSVSYWQRQGFAEPAEMSESLGAKLTSFGAEARFLACDQ